MVLQIIHILEIKVHLCLLLQGAIRVQQTIITMKKWIRTSRLSIKNSVADRFAATRDRLLLLLLGENRLLGKGPLGKGLLGKGPPGKGLLRENRLLGKALLGKAPLGKGCLEKGILGEARGCAGGAWP